MKKIKFYVSVLSLFSVTFMPGLAYANTLSVYPLVVASDGSTNVSIGVDPECPNNDPCNDTLDWAYTIYLNGINLLGGGLGYSIEYAANQFLVQTGWEIDNHDDGFYVLAVNPSDENFNSDWANGTLEDCLNSSAYGGIQYHITVEE